MRRRSRWSAGSRAIKPPTRMVRRTLQSLSPSRRNTCGCSEPPEFGPWPGSRGTAERPPSMSCHGRNFRHPVRSAAGRIPKFPAKRGRKFPPPPKRPRKWSQDTQCSWRRGSWPRERHMPLRWRHTALARRLGPGPRWERAPEQKPNKSLSYDEDYWVNQSINQPNHYLIQLWAITEQSINQSIDLNII